MEDDYDDNSDIRRVEDMPSTVLVKENTSADGIDRDS
jgi:hypothetical protein